MSKELDSVLLMTDLPKHGLTAGDMGTVVPVHDSGKGCALEFMALAGKTLAVVTLFAHQGRSNFYFDGAPACSRLWTCQTWGWTTTTETAERIRPPGLSRSQTGAPAIMRIAVKCGRLLETRLSPTQSPWAEVRGCAVFWLNKIEL